MPFGDKTGPRGRGQKTGRGLGYCTGYSEPGFKNIGFGRGYGRGVGRGQGFNRGQGFGRGFGIRGFWSQRNDD